LDDTDLLCLSHIRWHYGFQRPHELMSRFAASRRVYFLEEPVVGSGFPFLSLTRSRGVRVLTPRLPRGIGLEDANTLVRQLLRAFLREHGVVKPVHWLSTPMMLPIVDELPLAAVVFDRTDEPPLPAGAGSTLAAREQELLARADVVFTNGYGLCQHLREAHRNVHPFPSPPDVEHFTQARWLMEEPDDQRGLPRPRIGYSGVIDERVDLALVDSVARRRPEWQLVMIGPVVNLDPASLPRAANIQYLGMKSYDDLPRYLAGWDVAMLPYARSAAAHGVSPTKAPEYLASGRPVVSTSVRDVVRPYGDRELVRIADEPEAFVAAVHQALIERTPPAAADVFLATLSWERTCADMDRQLHAAIERRAAQPSRRSVSRPIDSRPEAGAQGATAHTS
jgi:glycosyltransferase involved in cell wall biosynthesis